MFTKLTSTLLLLTSALTSAIPTPDAGNTYTAPYGKGTFQLLALTSDGYSGTWLSSWHVGAGESAAILTQNQSLANTFHFAPKRGDVYYTGGSKPDTFPFSMQLTNGSDYDGGLPKGYYYVALNIGEPKQGFSFSPFDRNLLDLPSGSYETFVACTTNASIFYGTTQEQLLWRGFGSKAPKEPGCRDVQLKAVFNH